ncbi:MAG: DinB family protein [Candidatus Eisenbacteria bacterium]
MATRTADEAIAALATVRARLLTELATFEDARFFEPPAHGGWGAAHVVEHLARVEGRIQQGARKVIAQGSDIRPVWFDALLKLPMRVGVVDYVRVRTVKGADPLDDAAMAGMSRAQLMERLAAVRAESEALLEETRHRDLSRIYLRHPFFGAFAVRDFLAWAAWHEERHRKQLGRIRSGLARR